MLFRQSQISESFSKIQNIKTSITKVQKENDQIEINIQNSMNSNNLEQKAKELLGMQKLTNKQTEYVTLPKTDYIEVASEQVVIEENNSLFETIIERNKIVFIHLFKDY